jgi:GAF domain-containing protein
VGGTGPERAPGRMLPGVEAQVGLAEFADAFAAITAGLVGGHDAVGVLRLVVEGCVEVFGAAAGVLVVDPRDGGLQVAAASDERASFVELLRSQAERGPALDAVRAGGVVDAADLRAEPDRWPAFAAAAVRAGYPAVRAVPLRLDGRSVGALVLLSGRPGPVPRWQPRLLRALADLAALGLSQERDPRRTDRLVEQTLTALNDRVRVAHAVGLVAGTLGVDQERARDLLERHARERGLPVPRLARDITDGAVDPGRLGPDRAPSDR